MNIVRLGPTLKRHEFLTYTGFLWYLVDNQPCIFEDIWCVHDVPCNSLNNTCMILHHINRNSGEKMHARSCLQADSVLQVALFKAKVQNDGVVTTSHYTGTCCTMNVTACIIAWFAISTEALGINSFGAATLIIQGSNIH